jgi:eukaryotic-like serine/threonine-protein kinase
VGASLGERQPTEVSTAASGPKRRPKLVWAAGLLTLAAVCAGVVWLVQSDGPTSQGSLLPIPLTAYPGWEDGPSFSPDGSQITFCWNGERQDNVDIYVKLIGTGGQVRLTSHPDHETSPVWSPDGRWIAFRRLPKPDKVVVLLKPAIGGEERTLAEVDFSGFGSRRSFFGRDLAWHPSGKWLAVSDRLTPEGTTHALLLLSTETGEKRRLTSPPSELLGDHTPSFSPDGLHLAFSRWGPQGSLSHIYLLDLAKDPLPQGEPKRLTFENRRNVSAVWTPDGREVLFTSGPQHRFACGEWQLPGRASQSRWLLRWKG